MMLHESSPTDARPRIIRSPFPIFFFMAFVPFTKENPRAGGKDSRIERARLPERFFLGAPASGRAWQGSRDPAPRRSPNKQAVGRFGESIGSQAGFISR